MSLPRVIGIYSSAPRSGKTTAAQYLKSRWGYQIISFATPMKRMVTQFLHGMGYAPAEIDHFLTEGKSMRHPKIGVDTRHILQTLGTEWGRNCIHPEVWVQMWERQVMKALDAGSRVVCDDVRFPNEYRCLRYLPDNEFWVVDRYTARKTTHSSEGFVEQSSNVLVDRRLDNNGTVEDIQMQIANQRVGHASNAC